MPTNFSIHGWILLWQFLLWCCQIVTFISIIPSTFINWNFTRRKNSPFSPLFLQWYIYIGIDSWIFYSVIRSSLLLFIFAQIIPDLVMGIPSNLFLSISPIICFKHSHTFRQHEVFHSNLVLFLKSAIFSESFHFYWRMAFRKQNMGTSYAHCYCSVTVLGLRGYTWTSIPISILISMYFSMRLLRIVSTYWFIWLSPTPKGSF